MAKAAKKAATKKAATKSTRKAATTKKAAAPSKRRTITMAILAAKGFVRFINEKNKKPREASSLRDLLRQCKIAFYGSAPQGEQQRGDTVVREAMRTTNLEKMDKAGWQIECKRGKRHPIATLRDWAA